MLCKIYTDDSVGLLGKSHKCRLIHLHRHLANGIWPTKLEAFWDWLAGKADNMDVLMGDFNMSLFLVVPELRKRGVTIDLAAWFPWKQRDCTPMADSCAIFFINRPGIYQLVKGRHCLHAHNQKGIYWDAASHQAAVAAGDPSGTGDFQVMGAEGPGYPFATFMPKDDLVYPCVKETLSPSKSQEELDELSKRGLLWRTKEKRLGMDFSCLNMPTTLASSRAHTIHSAPSPTTNVGAPTKEMPEGATVQSRPDARQETTVETTGRAAGRTSTGRAAGSRTNVAVAAGGVKSRAAARMKGRAEGKMTIAGARTTGRPAGRTKVTVAAGGRTSTGRAAGRTKVAVAAGRMNGRAAGKMISIAGARTTGRPAGRTKAAVVAGAMPAGRAADESRSFGWRRFFREVPPHIILHSLLPSRGKKNWQMQHARNLRQKTLSSKISLRNFGDGKKHT